MDIEQFLKGIEGSLRERYMLGAVHEGRSGEIKDLPQHVRKGIDQMLYEAAERAHRIGSQEGFIEASSFTHERIAENFAVAIAGYVADHGYDPGFMARRAFDFAEAFVKERDARREARREVGKAK